MRKLRSALQTGIVALMGGVFLYGLARFPDGPIHPCEPGGAYLFTQHPDDYCGKQGQPHTMDDYRAYQLWHTALSIIWPLGIGALILIKYLDRKS
jgi:hypothetical protein